MCKLFNIQLDGEIILESLGKYAEEVGATSNHLLDLVTTLGNTTVLIWHNEQTFGDLGQVVESGAFVEAGNKIMTNRCDAAQSLRMEGIFVFILLLGLTF
jgi:hypothetical protein